MGEVVWRWKRKECTTARWRQRGVGNCGASPVTGQAITNSRDELVHGQQLRAMFKGVRVVAETGEGRAGEWGVDAR